MRLAIRKSAGGLAGAMFAVASAFASLSFHAHSAGATDNTAILLTSAGTYEFSPTLCAIYQEDGVYDIEIGGQGKSPSGEDAYFELSSTANALSVSLGVTGPFASSERKIQAGTYVSREFALEVAGRTIIARNLALVDENGAAIDDDATLSIDCNS